MMLLFTLSVLLVIAFLAFVPDQVHVIIEPMIRGKVISRMVVLFLMGTHSAFLGPPKYGILPEMLRSEDLPRANGVILMTTFLAITCFCASFEASTATRMRDGLPASADDLASAWTSFGKHEPP